MRFRVVIPARYAATRLPGKPLALLAGLPMIVHVLRRAEQAGAESVLVATDDTRIVDAVHHHGGTAVLTAVHHASGTERCAEVAAMFGWDDDEVVINLQGDEPLMPPVLVRQVAELLHGDQRAGIATLCTPLRELREHLDPNVVKVVFGADGAALYFSRAPIPWDRDAAPGGPVSQQSHRGAHRHLGLYAYRVATLARLTAAPVCELEQLEKLEQLRALWLGERIVVDVARAVPGPGVDTLEDLVRVADLLGG